MESMTDEQRKEFVNNRVQTILQAYDKEHAALSAMTPHERDEYVHRRIERSLLEGQGIQYTVEDYVRERGVVWRDMILLDIIALLIFGWIAVSDIRDVIGLAFIVFILAINRVVNYRLWRKSSRILELFQMHLDKETQTATLDFIVDEIELSNGDANKVAQEVNNIVENSGT